MNGFYEKIKIMTDNKVNISKEEADYIQKKAMQLTKKNTDNIEFDYVGYTWTFWYDKSNDGIKFLQIRIGDYTKMLAWEIKF